jgi:hypothetical protein
VGELRHVAELCDLPDELKTGPPFSCSLKFVRPQQPFAWAVRNAQDAIEIKAGSFEISGTTNTTIARSVPSNTVIL